MHNLICGFCSSDQRFARWLVCSPHPASFRFHLTIDTLAFGYILPTTGRIRDLHPLETCAAGRTTKTALILPERMLFSAFPIKFHVYMSTLSRLTHPSYVPFAPANRIPKQSASRIYVSLALHLQTIFCFLNTIIGRNRKRLNCIFKHLQIASITISKQEGTPSCLCVYNVRLVCASPQIPGTTRFPSAPCKQRS